MVSIGVTNSGGGTTLDGTLRMPKDRLVRKSMD